MKKLLGLVGTVAIAIFAAQISGVFTKFALFEGQRALISEEKIEKDLFDAMPRTMALVKEAFPEDYEAFLSQLLEGVKTGKSTETIRLRSAEAMALIRRKYADAAANAQADEIRAMIGANIKLIEEVRAKEGEKICSTVAANGPSALPPDRLDKYLATIDGIGAATFAAIRSGLDAPVERSAASDEDWGRVVAAMQADGVSEEELSVIGAVNSADPRYCRLVLHFLDEVYALEGEAGDRLRANFATELGKS